MDSSQSLIGQKIGNYLLSRFLGRGGFADVYLAEHVVLGSKAAVKIIHTLLEEVEEEVFLREAKTIANLRHPSIVRVFEGNIESNIAYLVMDYYPQGSLRDRYPHGSQLPPPLVANYVQQIAAALFYAHKEHLIHRDVKPENILLHDDDKVLLSDFGLVTKAKGSMLHTATSMAGTTPYMSPEQFSQRVGFASDQYSLAIVAYEWLAGKLPFTGTPLEIMGQHAMTSPPPLRDILPSLSSDIEQVILKALSKEPKDRFQTIELFAQALMNACLNVQSSDPRSTPPHSVPSNKSIDSKRTTSQTSTIDQPIPPPTVTYTAQPRTVSGDTPQIRVLDKYGKNIQIMNLTPQGITIGRQSSCDLVLNDPAISRQHALITWNGQLTHIKDLHSNNGTYLNDTKLRPHSAHVWQTGQSVRISSYLLFVDGLHTTTNASHAPAKKRPVTNHGQAQPVSYPQPGTNYSPQVKSAKQSPVVRWVLPVILVIVLITTGALAASILHLPNIFNYWKSQATTTIGKNTTLTEGTSTTTTQTKTSTTIPTTTTQTKTSSDKTWYTRISGTTQQLCAVIWSGSQFVAVGFAGVVLTSPDGITWNYQTSTFPSGWLEGVAWSGSQFVAVGKSGTVLSSPDGINWTSQSSGILQNLVSVTWANNQFVALGDKGTIITSIDGQSWASQNSNTSDTLVGIAWSGSTFVAVGWNGTTLTSPDGISWTAQSSGTSQELRGITWSGSQFVAVGFAGTIITSVDGIYWTSQIANTSQDLRSVAWSKSRFVVVGKNGIILTSPDGVSWNTQISNTQVLLRSVSSSDARFAVVGANGTILTSLTSS